MGGAHKEQPAEGGQNDYSATLCSQDGKDDKIYQEEETTASDTEI